MSAACRRRGLSRMGNKDGSEPPLDPDLRRGAWLTLIMIGGFLGLWRYG
jgi:hypothetical protein